MSPVRGVFVLCLDFLSTDFFEKQQHLVDRNPRTGAAVEDLSRRMLFLASKQCFFHNILDVREIARLFAVSIYHRRCP